MCTALTALLHTPESLNDRMKIEYKIKLCTVLNISSIIDSDHFPRLKCFWIKIQLFRYSVDRNSLEIGNS